MMASKHRRKDEQKERVAIVGSGMAGLVTAYLLANDKRESQSQSQSQQDGDGNADGDGNGNGNGGRFEVVLLEMQQRLSLDSASYTLPRRNQRQRRHSQSQRRKDDSGYDSSGESTGGSADEKLSQQQEEQQGDEFEAEEERRVDLPMRAFAAGYYDNLRKMYSYLGVRFEEPRFVYSLSTTDSSRAAGEKESGKGKEEGDVYFIHSSNNHILPPIRPPGMSVIRWVVEVAYLLFWYTVFTMACFWVAPRTATATLEPTASNATEKTPLLRAAPADETLRQYFTRLRVPTYYTSRYFLPLMSAVTTCTHAELLDFPAVDVVTYARRTFRRPHYTIKGGVRQAESKLAKGVDVWFGTRVTDVSSMEGGKVKVSWTGDNEGEEEFDKVIIAVTPDVVGKIFAPLKEEMNGIPTTSVSSIVHRDYSRISTTSAHLHAQSRFRRRAKTESYDGVGGISAAIHMVTDTRTARTESIHEHPSGMLITTYPLAEGGIEEGNVLHRSRFVRVLRSVASRGVVNGIFGSQRQLEDSGSEKDSWKNGDGGVYLVGGWCWDGMVMLEGCIVSAIRVADMLGVDVPWRS
ncbi:hypothetical protein BJY04DRAFT_192761 [Aspergillus karnatakaensis]|uniref:uncharacterized protein n=1 Tax=Aspergillus karnatakaensis TaxID=1810916 RepID=UPI003CCE4C8A